VQYGHENAHEKLNGHRGDQGRQGEGPLEGGPHEARLRNGVWQMMVAASSLHERQERNLVNLRKENSELKLKVNGMFGEPLSRVVGGKLQADTELLRKDVEVVLNNMGGDFAKDIGCMY